MTSHCFNSSLCKSSNSIHIGSSSTHPSDFPTVRSFRSGLYQTSTLALSTRLGFSNRFSAMYVVAFRFYSTLSFKWFGFASISVFSFTVTLNTCFQRSLSLYCSLPNHSAPTTYCNLLCTSSLPNSGRTCCHRPSRYVSTYYHRSTSSLHVVFSSNSSLQS